MTSEPPSGAHPDKQSSLPGLPLPTSPPKWVIYVDLDAFYVACELLDRPDLTGRAVIVGPPPGDGPSRGVVLSASYEARKFGVHSAQPVAAAARLCPDAVWIRPDPSKYERTSGRVRELLRRFSEEVLPYSIDEAAVVLPDASSTSAKATAAGIQRALKEELGLPASLGVATTRLVAKIATDRAKPGGIVVVPPEEVATFVAPLPVRAVPGVGPKTEEVLRRAGVRRIGDFLDLRPGELRRQLGAFGSELLALARGEPREAPGEESGPRSRSTDRTFPEDVGRWEEVETTVRELARELSATLDREGWRYGAVGVALRWADFSRSQRIHSLPASREGPALLSEFAVRLARELWETERAGAGRPVRTVSVRTERLTERRQRQVSLDDFRPGGPPPRTRIK